jgi:hypothetical protein
MWLIARRDVPFRETTTDDELWLIARRTCLFRWHKWWWVVIDSTEGRAPFVKPLIHEQWLIARRDVPLSCNTTWWWVVMIARRDVPFVKHKWWWVVNDSTEDVPLSWTQIWWWVANDSTEGRAPFVKHKWWWDVIDSTEDVPFRENTTWWQLWMIARRDVLSKNTNDEQMWMIARRDVPLSWKHNMMMSCTNMHGGTLCNTTDDELWMIARRTCPFRENTNDEQMRMIARRRALSWKQLYDEIVIDSTEGRAPFVKTNLWWVVMIARRDVPLSWKQNCDEMRMIARRDVPLSCNLEFMNRCEDDSTEGRAPFVKHNLWTDVMIARRDVPLRETQIYEQMIYGGTCLFVKHKWWWVVNDSTEGRAPFVKTQIYEQMRIARRDVPFRVTNIMMSCDW